MAMKTVSANRVPKPTSETIIIEILDKGKGGYIVSKDQPQSKGGMYVPPKRMVFGPGDGAKLIEYLEQNCISAKERATEEASEARGKY